MSEHTATVDLTLEHSHGVASMSLEAVMAFTFVKGYPATGPSYSSGGEPGEPDGLENLRVERLSIITTVQRVTATVEEIKDPPKWLTDWVVDNCDHSILLEEVPPDGPDPDEAYDRMRDERDERRLETFQGDDP